MGCGRLARSDSLYMRVPSPRFLPSVPVLSDIPPAHSGCCDAFLLEDPATILGFAIHVQLPIIFLVSHSQIRSILPKTRSFVMDGALRFYGPNLEIFGGSGA